MRFLASFILSAFLVAYCFLVKVALTLVPLWLSPPIIILALSLAIYFFTGIGRK